MWGATDAQDVTALDNQFQSTLPVWGATTNISRMISRLIFQSTLPVWGATTLSEVRPEAGVFQSTLPVWGATRSLMSGFVRIKHFNPRSPCGERPRDFTLLMKRIHFNPRSPCGERPVTAAGIHAAAQFQSTLPVWGATPEVELGSGLLLYFNPRSPCGERQSGCGSYP